jgi:hypothetical protein
MQVWIIMQVMLIFTGLVFASTVLASDQKLKNLKRFQALKTEKITQSKVYTHPVSGYKIVVPPGTQLSERDNENPQISIQSRKGYRVSIQSAPTRPEVSLKDMALILEAKYLGKGKPWKQKENQIIKQISGLLAIETSYRGSNMRSRVDIIRGSKTDHVFIFFAAEREYQNLEHEYVWILDNFKPGPDDFLKPKAVLESNFVVFEEPGYGYSIQYPKDWVHLMPSEMTAMFSGARGNAAYSAIVSVQNISPPQVETSDDAARAALAELKLALKKSVQGLKVRYEKPWDYIRERFSLNGWELEVSYTHAGQDFFKKIIIIPRPLSKLAHIWSYTAPAKIFDIYSDTANKMLLSWTILTEN